MDNLQRQRYAAETDGNGFVIGLLCGAAIGAAIGLMFAPKPGAELRQTLYDSTGDFLKKASDTYAQATQTINETVASGKDAMQRGREAFDSVYSQGRQTMHDVGESAGV